MVDFLEENNIMVFGANKIASQLEGSKIFTKKLCEKYQIPTAKFGVFKNIRDTKEFIEKNIKSKDTKGNPNKFEIKIFTSLIVNKGSDNTLQKSFNISNIYNVFESEFEQNKYEKKIERTLISKISQKLIIYLQTL